MQRCEDNVAARLNGNALQPLSGVSVTVTDDHTGLLATLYSDNGVTQISQPLMTDDNGYYGFYAANGEYTLSFSSSRIATFTRHAVLQDPDDNPHATKAELAAGQGAAGIGFGSRKVADKLGESVSVYDFGVVANGNGTGGGTDQTAKFQAAGDALAAAGGGTLRVPFAGTGFIRLDSQINGWANVAIVIDDAMTLDFTNKTSGYGFLWSGTYGTEIPLGVNAARGDEVITTATPHGLVVGDWLLLKSQRACLHADAGADWRLGITTTNTTSTFFAEPMQVESVQSATQFTTCTKVMFPSYRTDRTQETYVSTRVSTIAKINFLRGASIKGGRFIGGGATITRFDWCYTPEAELTSVSLGYQVGSAVQMHACMRGKVKATARRPSDFTIVADHSQYNSFKEFGCWWNIWEIYDHNGSQGMDITWASGEHPSIMPTIRGGAYNQKETGVTFHSGAYGGTIEDFKTSNCKLIAIYNRSRFVTITSPYLEGPSDSVSPTQNSGITLEGWATDCTVRGGFISGYKHGIISLPYSLIDPSPDLRNQTIDGVRFRHCDDAVSLQFLSSRTLTTAPSGITVANIDCDQLTNYGVDVQGYVHYVTVRNVRIGTITSGTGYGVYLRNNVIGTRLDGIEGNNIGTGNTLIKSSGITDTTTFPVASYPRALTDLGRYMLTGNGSALSTEAAFLNTQAGDYTIQASDRGQTLISSASAAATWTIPNDTAAQFERGAKITVVQTGAGQVTFAAASGVTVNGRLGKRTAGQWATVTLTKTSLNIWAVSGDAVV